MLPTIVAYILMGAGCLALFALAAMVHIPSGNEELEVKLGFWPSTIAACISVVAILIAPFMISNVHGLSFLGFVFLILIYLVLFKIWQVRKIRERLEKQERELRHRMVEQQQEVYRMQMFARHKLDRQIAKERAIERRNLEIRANTDPDSIWHGIE